MILRLEKRGWTLKLDNTVIGLSIPDLIKIEVKLAALGINTKELLEFLDRDKIQLFAQQQLEIKKCHATMRRIAAILNEVENEGENFEVR